MCYILQASIPTEPFDKVHIFHGSKEILRIILLTKQLKSTTKNHPKLKRVRARASPNDSIKFLLDLLFSRKISNAYLRHSSAFSSHISRNCGDFTRHWTLYALARVLTKMFLKASQFHSIAIDERSYSHITNDIDVSFISYLSICVFFLLLFFSLSLLSCIYHLVASLSYGNNGNKLKALFMNLEWMFTDADNEILRLFSSLSRIKARFRWMFKSLQQSYLAEWLSLSVSVSHEMEISKLSCFNTNCVFRLFIIL